MSAMATAAPLSAQYAAMWVASVLLPLPPFRLTTAMTDMPTASGFRALWGVKRGCYTLQPRGRSPRVRRLLRASALGRALPDEGVAGR